MRCPHCGDALYRDDDGLACLCGFRKYDLPIASPVVTKRGTPEAQADDNVGWWVPVSTTPDAIKKAGAELAVVIAKHSRDNGLTDLETIIALRFVMMRLENRHAVKLSRAQECGLKGYLHHLIRVDNPV